MNIFIKKIGLLFLISLIFTNSAFALDIFKADQYLKDKQYQLAQAEYLTATKVGNPYACYQLATIYFKGLAGDKDIINAMLYFSLAAEYQFHDSQAIIDGMLNEIPLAERKDIIDILTNFKKTHGKESINSKYLPVIASENLADKVTFNGKPTLEIVEEFQDYLDDQVYLDNTSGSFDENGEEESFGFENLIQTATKPYLIIDFDLAVDGSARNITTVQKVGFAKELIDSFVLFPLDQASIKEQKVEFIGRANLGAANYTKFTLLKENKSLYSNIRRTAIKYKEGTSLKDRYNYAMALLNFSWLEQQKGEAALLLKALAQDGHPGAMLEYGLKNYREQTDIPAAIYWIAQASKYGLARAEYRLGQLLLTSHWVKTDEKKALFWFESAMEKDHEAAVLKAITIRLTAADEQLRDVNKAISLLAKIADSHANNPEYYYLLALSHRYRENRQYTEVVDNLRKAISMGQRQNWDVSDWQALLTQLTTGRVYISD
ncbi:MAG: tetratricopeptide repeat protein [Thalassotalea sp.]